MINTLFFNSVKKKDSQLPLLLVVLLYENMYIFNKIYMFFKNIYIFNKIYMYSKNGIYSRNGNMASQKGGQIEKVEILSVITFIEDTMKTLSNYGMQLKNQLNIPLTPQEM